jgi:hypothetical protein
MGEGDVGLLQRGEVSLPRYIQAREPIVSVVIMRFISQIVFKSLISKFTFSFFLNYILQLLGLFSANWN